MFNKVVLVGNLTKDITIRYSAGGMAIASASIATSRKFTSNGEKKEEVCFVDITFFGRSAEIANQYLRKGSKILVEGRLNFDQWVDNNGQKKSKHSVNVSNLVMLGNKNDNQGQSSPGEENGSQHPSYNPTPQQQQDNQNRNNHQSTPSMDQQVPDIDIDEDEIPF